ncbi:hypothetical protein AXG93_1964s1060 [Marchantia polymorpha subsp. ruderalis]|uniref:Uncharacterized protein n=1 Tax=Marchantia polymorpha subsp. ruderalis TaxID=1480154 RepID=A0A176VV23_MARPO|nr:hypothetical protein AXG93_1964s1060 [Marchantia polymorpha subsp. ruderalis]
MLRLAVELCLSGDGLMPIGSCVETFDGAYLAWRWDDVGSELHHPYVQRKVALFATKYLMHTNVCIRYFQESLSENVDSPKGQSMPKLQGPKSDAAYQKEEAQVK